MASLAGSPERSSIRTVVFDWDGTAVPDRMANASAVRGRVERLCELGVDVVVVSGTNVGNVGGQLGARPSGPGRLFICANRGSEVFSVDGGGPSLVWLRKATDEEEVRLTAAAEGLRDELARRGLRADIVYDRLNRRKVDLIPEWPDPRKAEFTLLLRRVEGRLADAGLDGLAQVLDLAAGAAARAGLPEARLTSDIKHVEIGLTDKADSIRWVADHLLRDTDPEGVLVLGDEFGFVGGVPGSDSRMLAIRLPGAEFVSMGAEPGGVPQGVRHIGGGPAAFLEVLDALVKDLRSFPEPVEDPSWRVEVEGFDPFREREVESWLAVGNGRIGTRGSLEEGGEGSTPATYLAGLYGLPEDGPAGPELVPGPEWTRLRPTVADEPMDLDRGTVLEQRRLLDLRRGMLFRRWRRRFPPGGEVTFRSARYASLGEREVTALEARVEAEGFAVRLADGVTVPSPGGALEAVEARTGDGGIVVNVRGRGDGSGAFAIATEETDGAVVRVMAAVGGNAAETPERDAEGAVAAARALGIERLRARHETAWRRRWREADVLVEGDPEAQLALRFALYHLISAADPENDRASVGARGLTGPGYRGHVFWDTDVFVVPFFIYTHPPTARAHMAYRHRGLPAARAKVAALGFRGALYAWEAADTGEEVTPSEGMGPDGRPVPILTGVQEHHISADVAWAAWRYWQATADISFLHEMGGEMILETARFWASRARLGRDGRFHISRVIGPDEYHEGVRDNAFTNVMARWNLDRGLEVAELLRETDPKAWRALAARLELRRPELARWRRVASALVDGFDPETRLYEQFAGFFGLEDVRAAELAVRPFAADAVLGRTRLGRSQVVKQADVLMLAHMVPDLVPWEVAATNYRYYEPRTSHGSSLSPAIHAAVAARTGDLEGALGYFRMAAAVDLGDGKGNAAQGIHMATMGGLWQAAVMGFGGFRPDDAAVRVDPRLPPGWSRLAFPLTWRGERLLVDVTRNEVVLTVHGSAPVALGSGPPERLSSGRYAAHGTGGRWFRWKKVRAA